MFPTSAGSHLFIWELDHVSHFTHQESKVVQRDYRDTDGDLIAPHELYEKLMEGTLFSTQITLHTNIFNGKSGYPRKKYACSP